MTCVVALEENGKIYFGGDRYCGFPESRHVDLTDVPKVYKCSNVLIGICGSVKCEQVLEMCAKKHFTKRKVTRAWIQNTFMEILRKEMIKKNLFVESSDGQFVLVDSSTFLLGVNGEILTVQDDLSICRSPKGFAAIGADTGVHCAKGALSALMKINNLTPEQKVAKALEVAEEFCDVVRGPFDIISK